MKTQPVPSLFVCPQHYRLMLIEAMSLACGVHEARGPQRRADPVREAVDASAHQASHTRSEQCPVCVKGTPMKTSVWKRYLHLFPSRPANFILIFYLQYVPLNWLTANISLLYKWQNCGSGSPELTAQHKLNQFSHLDPEIRKCRGLAPSPPRWPTYPTLWSLTLRRRRLEAQHRLVGGKD